MRLFLISIVLLVGCNEPIDNSMDYSIKLSEQTLKDASENNRKLDSILAAVRYMGIRDSFMNVAHGLEVLYYKTEQEKYRIKHNKLVDSINKYDNLFMSQLNKK